MKVQSPVYGPVIDEREEKECFYSSIVIWTGTDNTSAEYVLYVDNVTFQLWQEEGQRFGNLSHVNWEYQWCYNKRTEREGLRWGNIFHVYRQYQLCCNKMTETEGQDGKIIFHVYRKHQLCFNKMTKRQRDWDGRNIFHVNRQCWLSYNTMT